MNYLSNESFELLKALDTGSVILNPHTFDNSCIDQLIDNGFIGFNTDYDCSGPIVTPDLSDYFVTEKGKGYIAYRKYDEEFHFSVKSMADSAKETAEASKIQSDLAIENSKQAQKDAAKANKKFIISVIGTFISAAIALLASLDQIYLNMQRILLHLGF